MLALVMGGLMVAALLPLTGSPASLALLAFSSAAAGAQLSADALYGPPNALDLAPVPACIAVAPPAPGWPTALYIGEQIEVLVECEPGVNLAIPACAGYIFEPAILSPAADSVGVTVYALVARAHIPTDADSRMSIIAGDGRAWPGVVVSLPAILALGEITVRFGSGRRVLYEDEALAVEFTLSHLPRDMLILTPHIRSGSESPAFRPRTLAFTPQSPLQGTVIIDLAVGTTHISVTCEGADAQHFSLEPKFLLSGLNVTVLPLESFTLSPRWATDIYVGETAVYSVTASVQPEAPITLTPFFPNATFSPTSISFGSIADRASGLPGRPAQLTVTGGQAGNGTVVFYLSGSDSLVHYSAPDPLPLRVLPTVPVLFDPSDLVIWPGDSVTVRFLVDLAPACREAGFAELLLDLSASDASDGTPLRISPQSIVCDAAAVASGVERCDASFTVSAPDEIEGGGLSQITATLSGPAARAYAPPPPLQVVVRPKLRLFATLLGAGDEWYVGQERVLVVTTPFQPQDDEGVFDVVVTTRAPPSFDAAPHVSESPLGDAAVISVYPNSAQLVRRATNSSAEFRLTARRAGPILLIAHAASADAHRSATLPIEATVQAPPTFTVDWPAEPVYVEESISLTISPSAPPAGEITLVLHADCLASARGDGSGLLLPGLQLTPTRLQFHAGRSSAQVITVTGDSPAECTVWSSLLTDALSTEMWVQPPANGTITIIGRGTFAISPAVLGPLYVGEESELNVLIAHSPLRSLDEGQMVALDVSTGGALVELNPTHLSWAAGDRRSTRIRVLALAAGSAEVRFQLASAQGRVAFSPPDAVRVTVRSRETVRVVPWDVSPTGVVFLREYKGHAYLNVTISRPPIYAVTVRPVLPDGLELEPRAARFEPCPSPFGGDSADSSAQLVCSPTTVAITLRALSALGTVSIAWSVSVDDHGLETNLFASPPNTTVVVSPIALLRAKRVEGATGNLSYRGDVVMVDVWPQTPPSEWRGDLKVTARPTGEGCTIVQPVSALVFHASVKAQRISLSSTTACRLTLNLDLSGPGVELFTTDDPLSIEFAAAEELKILPSTTVAYVGRDLVHVNVSVMRIVAGESLELSLLGSTDVDISPPTIVLNSSQLFGVFAISTHRAATASPLHLSITGDGSALAHVRVPTGDVGQVQLITLETFSILASYPDLFVGDLAALSISVTKHLDQEVSIRPWGRGLLFSPPVIHFLPEHDRSRTFAVQGTVTGDIPITYELGGANAAHFIEPVESHILIKPPEGFIFSTAIKQSRYVGETSTLVVQLSASPYVGVTLTPAASCLDFTPGTLEFTSESTEAQIDVLYRTVGACTVQWLTGGPNMLHFSAPPSQAVVVRLLEVLSIPTTLRLFAAGKSTLRIQAPAECAIPEAECSRLIITPHGPGLEFVPASAPLSVDVRDADGQRVPGAVSFELRAERNPGGPEADVITAIDVEIALTGDHRLRFEQPGVLTVLHTPLERLEESPQGGGSADGRSYYVGEAIQIRLKTPVASLARAADGVPAAASQRGVLVTPRGPGLRFEPPTLEFNLTMLEVQEVVVVCYSAGLSSVSFELSGALAAHYEAPPPIVLRLLQRSTAYFVQQPPDGAAAGELVAQSIPFDYLYEFDSANFSVALAAPPLRNVTIRPVADGMRFDPPLYDFTPLSDHLFATFRAIALAGARATAIGLERIGPDAPFYDAASPVPVRVQALKRLEVARELGAQYVGEETTFTLRLSESPRGEITLTVAALEPCSATPSTLAFDERTVSGSIRVKSSTPASCTIRFSMSGGDAPHFAVPAQSTVVVLPHEHISISFEEKDVVSLHNDTRLTVEVSRPPEHALTVTPIADDLLFDPPAAVISPGSNQSACSFGIVGRRPGTYTVSFALNGRDVAHMAPPPTATIRVRPMEFLLPRAFLKLVAGVPSGEYVVRVPDAASGASVTLALNGSNVLRADPPMLVFGANASRTFALTGLAGGNLALAFSISGADAELFSTPPPVEVQCEVIAASRLRLLSVPTKVVAGAPFNVVVEVLDPDGHRHVDLSGQPGITISLIVMTYEQQIFEGVSTSSIEEADGLANATIVMTKAMPIRLVASAPGLAADSSLRITVLPNTLSPNATLISCGRKHILVGQAVTCLAQFRDAFGNGAPPPAGVHAHINESDGSLLDVQMLGDDVDGRVDAGPAALNLTFTPVHTGVVMLVVHWIGIGGANESFAQSMSIFAGMLVPSMTDFSCAPNPVRAGEVTQCTIVTRGPFGNRAAGADVSEFEVLIGPGFSYSSAVHAKGVDELGFVVYAERAQESSISIRFRGDRWGQKSVFLQVPMVVAAGDPAMDLSTMSCEPNPVMQGAPVACQVTARDHFGNVARLSPLPSTVTPGARGEILSETEQLLRALDARALDSSGQLLQLSSPVTVGDDRSRIEFSFTAGRMGPTEVTLVFGGRAAVGHVLVTPPRNAFLPASPYRFEGGSQSARDQLLLIIAFGFLAIASKHLAKLAQAIGVPLVTGYLAVGIIVGPHGLMLLPYNGPSHLSFIGKLALGFIGFSAGAKFYLNELKEYIRPVLYITAGLVLVTYASTFCAVLLFGDVLPYTHGMTSSQRLGIALLFGCLSVARSPSSSIAIISEMNAAGPFVTITLAVIIMMDVLVVVLFSLTSLAVIALDKAGSAEGGGGPDAHSSDVLIIFALQMVVSVVGGFVVANILVIALVRVPTWQVPAGAFGPALSAYANGALHLLSSAFAYLQMAFFLALGFGVFALESLSSEILGFAIMQPMIVCMMAGAALVNYSNYREAFNHLCHAVSPLIYISFFTLTGAEIELDAVPKMLPSCALIFTARTLGIILGTNLGGWAAKIPTEHRTYAWMAFMTQAGVTLGLARQIATHFSWGPQFATNIVAVVVCNELTGPLLFKYAIGALGEAGRGAREDAGINLPPSRKGGGGVVVFLEPRDHVARDICAQLVRAGWEVAIADLAAVRKTEGGSFRDSGVVESTDRGESRAVKATHPSRHRRSWSASWRAQGGGVSGDGDADAESIPSHPSQSVLGSLPIGQLFHPTVSSGGGSAALLAQHMERSTDEVVGGGAQFEVDLVKLNRIARVVENLDFVLLFTPFDEANVLLCQAIFDYLPRYKRPHVVMSIADPCWDDALNALSPPPIQMMPSIAVAQFLSSALATVTAEHGDVHSVEGMLIDMTAVSSRERGESLQKDAASAISKDAASTTATAHADPEPARHAS